MMLKRVLVMAGLASVLTVGMNSMSAQNGPVGGGPGPVPGGGTNGPVGPGGRFDPAQFHQRMTENLREQLGIKDDAEWKAIEPKARAVFEARMAAGGGPGAMRGMGRPPRDNPAAGQHHRGPGAPSVAAEALQKAIDAKAPAAELKTKLEAYRAEGKEKEAAVVKAQEDLRKLLTPQQEAVAVLNGLLK